MTIFSTPEEEFFESTLKGAKVRYYPAAALKQAGGNTDFADAWKSHVLVDRELITLVAVINLFAAAFRFVSNRRR